MKPGEPSATSRVIAAATVQASLQPDQAALVPPAAALWCARFLEAFPAGRRSLRSARSPLQRAFHGAVERMTLPGVTRHWQLRKLWLERRWEEAVREDFGQLLVLGAGLDTLAVREAERDPTLRVVEVDHPATQGAKATALRDHGFADRVRLVPVDLATGGLAEAALALDPRLKTFVISEGLLMYLEEPRVRSLLGELAALPVPRIRLALTHMDRGGFSPQSRLVSFWLKLRGEPFRWTASPEDVAAMLGECGWRVIRQVRSERIAEDLGLEPATELRGEDLALAERNGPTAAS